MAEGGISSQDLIGPGLNGESSRRPGKLPVERGSEVINDLADSSSE